MDNRDLLPILAEFLAYPGPSTLPLLGLRVAEVGATNPPVSRQLARYVEFARSQSLAELQELFTRTFDLNPVCSLEVGWHLYGEDYRRGRFLASIRRQLAENGIKESGELPDHLTHMLPLLGKLETGRAERLGRDYVGRSVRRMVESLEGGVESESSEENATGQAGTNPFLTVLQSIEVVLTDCWGPIPEALPMDTQTPESLEVIP